MTCPSCGYTNEAAAQACNLCGKLLISKPAPAPPAASAPSRVVAAVNFVAEGGVNMAPGRVPSWPNQAILCFLILPSLILIGSPFLLLGMENEGSESPGRSLLMLLWLVVPGGGSLVATVPVAARLVYAPHVATALCVLTWVVSMILVPFPNPAQWVMVGGVVLAWVGRAEFKRGWDPARILGWTLQGYRRLLAPDRRAWLRLVCGIAVFLGGIVLMYVTGTALSATIPLSRPVAKFLAIPSFIGGFVAASALSFTEPRESK